MTFGVTLSVLILTFLACITMFLSAGYQRGKEVDTKAVAASFVFPNAIHLDPTGTATISSPKGREGVGCQEAIHFSTTGQMKTVSESRVGRGREGRGGEGREGREEEGR